MYKPMTPAELQTFRHLLGKLRVDMELTNGSVYCGEEITTLDDLAAAQLDFLAPATALDRV
jgi:hypothetical protein